MWHTTCVIIEFKKIKIPHNHFMKLKKSEEKKIKNPKPNSFLHLYFFITIPIQPRKKVRDFI